MSNGKRHIALSNKKKIILSYVNFGLSPFFLVNNRGITLLDISGKAFLTILLLRVKDEVYLKMRKNGQGLEKKDPVKTKPSVSISSSICV